MTKVKMMPDEVILFDGQANSKEYNGNLLITLTSKRIIIEKIVDTKSNDFLYIDEFLLSNIKIYKDKVQVRNKVGQVDIQTIEKNLTFSFKNILNARKFTVLIINTLTNTTTLTRNAEKIIQVIDVVDETLKIDTRQCAKNILQKKTATKLISVDNKSR